MKALRFSTLSLSLANSLQKQTKPQYPLFTLWGYRSLWSEGWGEERRGVSSITVVMMPMDLPLTFPENELPCAGFDSMGSSFVGEEKPRKGTMWCDFVFDRNEKQRHSSFGTFSFYSCYYFTDMGDAVYFTEANDHLNTLWMWCDGMIYIDRWNEMRLNASFNHWP